MKLKQVYNKIKELEKDPISSKLIGNINYKVIYKDNDYQYIFEDELDENILNKDIIDIDRSYADNIQILIDCRDKELY